VILNMKKKVIVLWTDDLDREHAYLIEGKDLIDPEAFAFHLRCHKTVKRVKTIQLEEIRNEHAPVIIRSLQPLPKEFGTLMKEMKTEHGTEEEENR